ncbi:MAG: hypothetical protein WCC74_01585 [Minisyncoccia bacterium]
MRIILIAIGLSTIAGNLFAEKSEPINYAINEKIIQSRITTNAVGCKYSPVFIYRSLDFGKTGSLAGTGSLYVENGQNNIVTAEHLFDKTMGKQVFVYRPLRPYEPFWTFPIERVLKNGSDIVRQKNKGPDVTILRCGSLKVIDCFSENLLTNKMSVISYSRDQLGKRLTSLITGKTFPVVGMIVLSNNKSVKMFVIEYTSICGESGTGFIDQEENLYVLCSNYSGNMDGYPQPFTNMFGTTNELSMLYGPIPNKSH